MAPLLLKMKPMWDLIPVGIVMLIAAWAPAVALWRGKRAQVAESVAVAAVVAILGLFTMVAPRLTPLWISSQIAEDVPADAPLTAAGFHEPSLVFLHGTTTLLTDGAYAAEFLLTTPGAWAAIEAEARPDFDARLAAAGRETEQEGEIDGFNYSRGRPAQVALLRLKP